MNILSSLRLQRFRSYDDFAVELSPSVNIIVGPNASGKTNLLEAVLLLAGEQSFRSSTVDVIQYGYDWARIEADLGSIKRSLFIEQTATSIKKRYSINENTRQRLRFDDILPTVVFEPEHMRLLTGSPDMRRDFLDAILSLLLPTYADTKKHYTRVLMQRNSLLKSYTVSKKEQLFVWNIRLSELAGVVYNARALLIKQLNERAGDVYGAIAGKKTSVVLTYHTSFRQDSYETDLLHMLEKTLQTDVERGFTGYGPHREDFSVELVGLAAKSSASRGETRTLVLSLKLLEATFIQEKRHTAPLVLLDDVFSELDGLRRKALTQYLKNNQTIITTTDADVIAKDFAQTANTISLG